MDAFLSDRPILQYYKLNNDIDCQFLFVDTNFGADSYGIAFPKGSPLEVSTKGKLTCQRAKATICNDSLIEKL